MAERRKCQVSKRIHNGQMWITVFDYEGWFHQWGCATEEDEAGFSSYSVALVEKYDGQIDTVVPSMIKFT